jgi:hypothetical protein
MTQIRLNLAQTFLLDSTQTATKITGIDLYFMYKPPATNNRSGVTNPGVTMYLTETIYNVPKITQDTFTRIARAEWDQIVTSSDASAKTLFRFVNPIEIEPTKLYAIVLAFDGNESFWPWTAKIGSWLVGTRTIYTGPSGNFTGEYYEYTATDIINDPTSAQSRSDYTSFWRPLDDTTLKFTVHAARYFINGQPMVNAAANLLPNNIVYSNSVIQQSNGSGQLDFFYPAQPTEHVTFSLANSTVMSFIGAQRVFQNTVFYPGGFQNGSSFVTVSVTAGGNSNVSYMVTANSLLPNGTAFNWNTVLGNYSGQKYVTIFDTSLINVRLVRSIISNTVIQVTEPLTFTNNIAKFFISPIATVDSVDTSSPRGKKTEFMRMVGSNANSTVRFVNSCVESITASPGGTAYKNTDILYIQGFQNVAGKVLGGYPAMANIVTNTTGGITTLYLSNLGCGFINASAMAAVVSNATSGNSTVNTSVGSGATFVYSVGATLRTELTANIFRNCTLVNLDVNDCTPFFDVSTPPGTTFGLTLKCQYYLVNDDAVDEGYAYYVYPEVGGQEFTNIQMLRRNRIVADKIPVFMSYSNEFQTLYANGANNDQVNALTITTNNFILKVHTTSNNDFIVVSVNTNPTIEFGKYIINDDYTKEETNFGNCWAKHVTTLTNFARISEDIRVYLDAYKPANTDLQVYARIQNSGDPQAFDDEDWTRLTLVDGVGMLSSLSNETDYIELTYAFQPYPNTESTFAGVVVTTNNSSNVVGANSTWYGSLAVNNMIRVYDPYFPNTNFMVATVTAISGATVTVDQPFLTTINPSLVQNGMKVEQLSFPHQAYNNITNDNVVRYYNTSLVKYDGFDILQIKVCLLSSHLTHYPRIRDIRATAISA